MWISDVNQVSADVGKKLQGKGWTIAVAESLTVGRLQAAMARVSGASVYFVGGMTAYSEDTKVRILGVERKVAVRDKCVSLEVAVQMARGVRTVFGTEVGVATTGYAEPVNGNPPYAYYAIMLPDGRGASGKIEAPSTMERPDVQEYIANTVLAKLNEML